MCLAACTNVNVNYVTVFIAAFIVAVGWYAGITVCQYASKLLSRKDKP